MSMASRLGKIEQMAKEKRIGVCSLCRGYPTVMLHERLAPKEDGPGCRTIRQDLSAGDLERVTEDYRCRQCGAQAELVILREAW
jgi:hypothetical protein